MATNFVWRSRILFKVLFSFQLEWLQSILKIISEGYFIYCHLFNAFTLYVHIFYTLLLFLLFEWRSLVTSCFPCSFFHSSVLQWQWHRSFFFSSSSSGCCRFSRRCRPSRAKLTQPGLAIGSRAVYYRLFLSACFNWRNGWDRSKHCFRERRAVVLNHSSLFPLLCLLEEAKCSATETQGLKFQISLLANTL